MVFIFGCLAVLAYLLASAALLGKVRSPGHNSEIGDGALAKLLPLLVIAAVALHLFTVYPQIVSAGGFNFSFFHIASLIFLIVSGLGLMTLLGKQPVHSLLLLLFPLAALAIACSLAFTSQYTPRSELSTGMAAHVLLSVVSMGLLTVAALQALLLLLQMQQLKQRNTSGLIESLPPLQTMEQLLFRVLWVGFICLSIALLLGGIYVEDLFAQHLVHKTVFSISAWVVFAVLLWGRYQLGWRGRTAVQWTLLGLGLLALGFFGTKLVLELILQRG